MSKQKFELKFNNPLPQGVTDALRAQVEKALSFLPDSENEEGGKPLVSLRIDPEKVGKGYSITRENAGGEIKVTGADAASLLRGVYAFAEKFCGVRKYTYSPAVMPKEKPVLVTGFLFGLPQERSSREATESHITSESE